MKPAERETRLMEILSAASGPMSARQIAEAIEPNSLTTLEWCRKTLRKMAASGDLTRIGYGSHVTQEYFYSLPSGAVVANVLENPVSNKEWRRERVLAVLGASGPMPVNELAKIIDPKRSYSRIMRSLNEDLAVLVAIGKIVRSRSSYGSGTAFLYSLAAETVTVAAEVVEQEQPKETPAPIEYHGIPEDIRKEFRLDAEGRAFISIRGAARLLGITDMALTAKNFPANLLQTLTQQGFQVQSFSAEGIPDTAFALIAEYYALDAGKWCKEQAKQVYRAFASIGVRLWIQKELNWQKTEIQPPAPALSLDKIPSQWEMISLMAQEAVKQEKRLADVESKIIKLEDYLERQEKMRQELDLNLLGLKQPMPLEPLPDRKALRALVRKLHQLTGEAWPEIWRDIYSVLELREEIVLWNEVKRLKANGLKGARTIDAVESLGLMQKAVAIAYDMIEKAKKVIPLVSDKSQRSADQ